MRSSINDIHHICNELNITVIDFYNEIYSLGNYDAFFPPERTGHYNSKGYKLLSDKLIENLK